MIDFAPLQYRVEPMRARDLRQVMAIEEIAFSSPWSERAFDYELHFNEMAHYFVARPQNGNGSAPEQMPRSFWQRLLSGEWNRRASAIQPLGQVIGYSGFWQMVDEAHISTIAVAENWRRRGAGELLLVAMIDAAADVGVRDLTLEVRASNRVAQALYQKYGFEVAGMRKAYYSDNNEDALIMTTPDISTASFARDLQLGKAALFKRLAAHA